MHPVLPGLLVAICMPAFAATTPCLTAEAAKAVAESVTLGEAVTARQVNLHRAGFPSWEVLVHRQGKKKGLRLIIDQATRKVLKRELVRNPPSKLR